MSGAAACILLLVGLAGIFFAGRMVPDGRMQQVVVPAGQRVELRLADGTKVWLNSKSRLEYPSSFGRRSRRVTLCGEGYFEVAHDERKPFVVETGQYDVRVLGTTFNVYAYDNDRAAFETALMEGSVEVSSRSDASQRLVLQPNEAAVMPPTAASCGRADRYGAFPLDRRADLSQRRSLRRAARTFQRLLRHPHPAEKSQTLRRALYGQVRQSDGIDYSLHVLQRFVNFRYTHDEERHTIEIR